MPTSKQTPADEAGARTKRQRREPSPEPGRRGWNPADDLYGDSRKPVDADLDFDGKFSRPPPTR
jgi:hypothetical protein